MFTMNNQFISDDQGHDSFEELSLSFHRKLQEEVKEQNYIIKSLEEIHLQDVNNTFIDSEEYISLILHNQFQNVRVINEKTSEENHLVKKYFNLWRSSMLHTEENQANDDKPNNRLKMIDDFFENIVKNKNDTNNKKKAKMKQNENTARSSTSNNKAAGKLNNELNPSESYQHRYQAQKNVIALQKMKILQQERVIEELKLKKYVEDAGATSDILSDVRRTLQNCDRILIKPKLKCIAGEEEKHLQEPGDLIVPYCTKVPRMIQQMEQRARQREEKRAMVRERRTQIEMERQRLKEQMELEKQVMDQEEKNRRLNEYKEKRKQEQLIAIRRKEFIEKMRALYVLADLHHEKKVMLKYGINAFRKYLVKIKIDYEQAIMHHKQTMMRNHLLSWRHHTSIVISKRVEIADNLYNTKIWRKVFDQLKMDHRTMVKKWQVAEDWYEFHVSERLFLLWRHNTRKIKYQRKKQWNLAVQHYNIQLLWRVVGCWQTLPTINKLEREHEARKQKWRLKVQQVLPDFIPRNVDEMDDSKYI